MTAPYQLKLRPSPATHPLVVRSQGHFARLAPSLSNSADSADITRWFPGVEDQDAPRPEGSCGGFAGAENSEARFGVLHGYQVPVRRSAGFLYAMVRLAMGTFPEDSGSDAATLFSILETAGCAGVDLCPYDGNPATRPSAAAVEAAKTNRMRDSLMVPRTPDAILGALDSGRAVSLVIEVWDSMFYDVDRYGNVPMPRGGESLRGLHLVTMLGGQRRWGPYGPNSWGTGWGENGWFRLPWAYIAQHTLEAWTAS
jgi:hypothetical protein